jgi:hypothetical protein
VGEDNYPFSVGQIGSKRGGGKRDEIFRVELLKMRYLYSERARVS